MNDSLVQSRTLFFQGIEQFENGQYIEARQAFEDALALAPGRPSILANLGITLFRLKHFGEAISVLKQADSVDPDKPDVLINLGLSHEACGNWQEAATALSRVLKLSPKHPDLWLTCGLCRLRTGDVKAALDAFDRAIGIAPDFAPAWSERGSLLRELNHLDEAAHCFERAIALGADTELHRFYLAAVKKGRATAEPPRQYVESLFDDYAAEFDDHLVGTLKYHGYEVLVRPLLEAGQRHPLVLDLGCGTGLCGKLIKPLTDHVDGVDLSLAMLERARQGGCYRDLVHADIGEFLVQTNVRPDLVLAADVFGYIRDLQPIFRSVRRILATGGLFAFTVELTHAEEDIEFRPSLRHAHSEAYVTRVAQACGFNIRNIHAAVLRQDQTDPVQALYVYLE